MFASNTSQVSSDAVYVEDVFSTWLFDGNSTTQVINNGIDLAGKGGMVWTKARNQGSYNHQLFDTSRGTNKAISSNTTGAEASLTDVLNSFNSNGFTLGTNANANQSGNTEVSWTFREQAKFFDVVTYTGNGANRTIAHNLGSVPGCIIVKRTDTTADWQVYHRSLANTEYMVLNTTAAKATGATRWNSTTPTSTEFSLGTDATVNANGGTYVAYIFAHDAGGFGNAGTDNVISCGGVTLDSGGGDTTVNLGYEPQWILARPTNVASNWTMFDNMRGWAVGGSQQRLRANLTNAEDTQTNWINITSTGFVITSSFSNPSDNVIYIAIRRGPMKTPTSGTSVFEPVTYTGNNASTRTISGAGFAPDLGLGIGRSGGMAGQNTWYDRLRGKEKGLISSSTGSEYDASTGGEGTMTMSGMVVDYIYGRLNDGTTPYIMYFAQRAPSFMDVVCYTGNSTNNRALNHNLGVAPELIIYKRRNIAADWVVMSSMFSNAGDALFLQSTSAISSNAYSGVPRPTATYFYAGDWGALNNNADTYVAYLFVTCAGVSKVGSYTGSGTTKQIDCGFTGGARFVLIKRTDSTGDWYVWDTARGIVSGNDPYLLLNSTAAEVTNTDYIDAYSAGFEISSTAPAAINASGGSFIFLAIS